MGHSARSVYQRLQEAGVRLKAKGIAVGLRVEHPQVEHPPPGPRWCKPTHLTEFLLLLRLVSSSNSLPMTPLMYCSTGLSFRYLEMGNLFQRFYMDFCAKNWVV